MIISSRRRSLKVVSSFRYVLCVMQWWLAWDGEAFEDATRKATSALFAPQHLLTMQTWLVHERTGYSRLLDHHVIKANKLLPCKICGKVSCPPSIIYKRTLVATAKFKMYPCDLCGKSMQARATYPHKKIHDGNNKVLVVLMIQVA